MYKAFVSSLCTYVLAVSFGASAGVAASPERELLNSERLEQAFGNYGIELLSSTPTVRVSKLYSTEDGREVCRTFAVVAYPGETNAAIAAEHSAILNGGSIGATFAAAGWRVSKVHRYFGELMSTARVEALMGGIKPSRLAVHVYTLGVSREGEEFDYASIIEVHHPDYLELADLLEVYGPQRKETDETVSPLLELTALQMR
jgi:hypothetical protein